MIYRSLPGCFQRLLFFNLPGFTHVSVFFCSCRYRCEEKKNNPKKPQSSSLSFHTTFNFCLMLFSLIPITLKISISKKSDNLSLKNLSSTQKIYCNKPSKNVDHMYRPFRGKKCETMVYICHCTSHRFLRFCPLISPLHITSDIANHWEAVKGFSKHQDSLNLLQSFLCFSLNGGFRCKIYGPEWQYFSTPEWQYLIPEE